MSARGSDEGRTALDAFAARVEARVVAIRSARDDWPCRRGCDGCCRRLRRPPELTAAEWARVDEAVAALDPVARSRVGARVEALLARIARGDSGPFVCPYLDEREGACRIYAARPLACRTYGFFVSRGEPEVCEIIDREVLGAPGADRIVWGNSGSLATEVAASLGEAVSFAAHFMVTPSRAERGPGALRS
jgi:Fe-S-cluster containining protein